MPRQGGVTRIRLGVGFQGKRWDRDVKVGEVGWVSAHPNSATQIVGGKTQTLPLPDPGPVPAP